MTSTMRNLIFDIETVPNLVHAWALFDQNIGINQIVEPTSILCLAWKWAGQPKVSFAADWHEGGHEVMIKKAYDLIDEADVVTHFNGKTFDLPHLRREFLLAGMQPPSPVVQIDILQHVKQNFKFPSNKLDYVANALGVGKKTQHWGHELWVRCMAGDPVALALMEKYNRQDVKITEKVYDKIRPWMKGHPHMGMFSGEGFSCPNCGSMSLQRRGERMSYTTNMVHQRYQCNDCGAWSRSAKSEKEFSTLTRGNNG